MKRIFAALLCLCLASCASVPLSTLLRASSFGEKDLAQIDPAQLRVRVTLPEGFGLDVDNSQLGIAIESVTNTYETTFQLKQEALQPAVIPGGMFAPDLSGSIYTLKLTEASQAEFQKLQRFINRNHADNVSIRVMPRLSAAPTRADSVKVSIALQLAAAQDWITLVDDAELSLDQYRARHPAN